MMPNNTTVCTITKDKGSVKILDTPLFITINLLLKVDFR